MTDERDPKPWLFKAGNPSANPKGRPSGYHQLARTIRDETMNGKVMTRYLLGLVLGNAMGVNGEIDKEAKKPAHRERIAAAAILLDRGWGKPLGMDVLLTSPLEAGRPEDLELASEALETLARDLRSTKPLSPGQATLEATKRETPLASYPDTLDLETPED